MGTSVDRAPGLGQAWTSLKSSAATYTWTLRGSQGGERGDADRVLSRHVAVLGGPGTAAVQARAGARGLVCLREFLTLVEDPGLEQALVELGMGHLVGASRFELFDGLATLVAGDASGLEQQAAREALLDVLDAVYEGAESWERLRAAVIGPEMVGPLLTTFLSRYVYHRLPVLGERLARLMDPLASHGAEHQIVGIVRALVMLPQVAPHARVGAPDDEDVASAHQAIRRLYVALSALEPRR